MSMTQSRGLHEASHYELIAADAYAWLQGYPGLPFQPAGLSPALERLFILILAGTGVKGLQLPGGARIYPMAGVCALEIACKVMTVVYRRESTTVEFARRRARSFLYTVGKLQERDRVNEEDIQQLKCFLYELARQGERARHR